jgi:hypothetical protein
MTTLTSSFNRGKCHNLNLRLMTNVKAYKGAGQEWSPKVTFYAPGGVGECEALNPRTPKWAPILGVRAPMDFQIFRRKFQGSKLIGLRSYLYYWKALEM